MQSLGRADLPVRAKAGAVGAAESPEAKRGQPSALTHQAHDLGMLRRVVTHSKPHQARSQVWALPSPAEHFRTGPLTTCPSRRKSGKRRQII